MHPRWLALGFQPYTVWRSWTSKNHGNIDVWSNVSSDGFCQFFSGHFPTGNFGGSILAIARISQTFSEMIRGNKVAPTYLDTSLPSKSMNILFGTHGVYQDKNPLPLTRLENDKLSFSMLFLLYTTESCKSLNHDFLGGSEKYTSDSIL